MSSEPVANFNIHDAKTHLSKIIERVEHGEEIACVRQRVPDAAHHQRARPRRGSTAGDPPGSLRPDAVAQARCAQLTLVTRDKDIQRYDVQLLTA
jgi:antitoxin (DNA-binding transcriptional repressor) of toxin-antitoxin stability system